MPHATCVKARLMYFPVPKNAGSAIRYCLYEIDHGRPYQRIRADGVAVGLYEWYGAPTSFERPPKPEGFLSFAVVRDPVTRLVSAYAHCVLRQPDRLRTESANCGVRADLPAVPDLSTFALHLPEYRKIPTIAHHTNAQSHFLGDDLRYYDRVFRLEALDELAALLSERVGMPVTLPLRKAQGPKPDIFALSKAERQAAAGHYRRDYALLEGLYQPY